MKVILINGSPRNGNTFHVLKLFEEKFKQKQIETELINIKDCRIEECIGCYKCVSFGKQFCPFKDDDTEKVWKKIATANGVILSAPVFALGIPSILKRFIDRIAYNAHRPDFYNKPVVLLSTTAGMGTENVFKQLQWFEIAGLRVISKVGMMIYPIGKDNEKTKKYKNIKIERSVHKLINSIYSDKIIKPKLIQVIQFFGLKLNCTFGKDIYKADYEYFLDRDFFTTVKVNPIKNIIGKMIYKIGIKSLENTIVKT